VADLEEPQDHRLTASLRLDTWKEIAAYLDRHVTTVRRWEKQEGLPVHRHLHDKLGSVYAFRGEVDEWWRGRRASLEASEGAADRRGSRDLLEPITRTGSDNAQSVPGPEGLARFALNAEASGSPNESGIAEVTGVEGGNGAGGVESATPDAERLDTPDASRWSGTRRGAAALITLMLGAAAIGAAVLTSRSVAPVTPVAQGPVARFVLPIETGLVAPGELALSPNGAYLAYTSVRSGAHTLYLRDLANPPEATAVATFEGANHPFFSPDSQWLGFFADGQMKKVSVYGGAPVTLADAPHNRRATWDSQASIVFAPSGRAGLFQVSANAGGATSITTPDADRLETSHAEPYWLPRSEAVVYVARGETGTESALLAVSLENGHSRVLLEGASDPRYMAGHLLYRSQGTLMAVPFDVDRLEVTGVPIAVIEDVGAYSISSAGTLVYAPRAASNAARQLVWVNRQGAAERLEAPARRYERLRLSPDGRRVALDIDSESDGNIWIYDFAREALTQLTFEGRNLWPIWSHDGRRVIYGSNRVGTTWDIYSKAADGTAKEQALLVRPLLQIPHSLSKDGLLMAVGEWGPTQFGISLYVMSNPQPRVSFASGGSAALSPDGRWVAYTSSESGRFEIYVRPTTGADGKWMISADGGREPLWAPSGRELFYRHRDQVLAVDIETAPGLLHRKPRVLFEGPYTRSDLELDGLSYDITPDGQRFLMLKDEAEPTTGQLNLVLNWQEELRRVMTGRTASR
jgi:serine/threonine-protein kinase